MKLHHGIANFFGYELSHLKKHHPTLESHLHILFDLLKIDTVFDVGANKGQYGAMLRKMGYQGAIYSFEPVNSCFQDLSTISASDDNWQVFNYALGEENTTMDINVMEASEFSSLLKPNDYGKELYAHKIPVKQTESIAIKKLDDVFAEIINNNSTKLFLKMDTQGYDLKVLAGAKEVLSQVLGLQSEISLTPLYEGMPDYLEALSRFKDSGFELTALYPVSRDPDSAALIELDCIMRKSAN
ncbi:MAG: FkbM family methyltransferase [Methylococcaceae bacterium]|nr:FkbM family methyltransferase [Methylococcaceae bacterium]